MNLIWILYLGHLSAVLASHLFCVCVCVVFFPFFPVEAI